jgi:hypothetical protein
MGYEILGRWGDSSLPIFYPGFLQRCMDRFLFTSHHPTYPTSSWSCLLQLTIESPPTTRDNIDPSEHVHIGLDVEELAV